MSSGWWRGTGGIACAEDAKTKAKAARAKAAAINLVIASLPLVLDE
jgi:hypothetical protein